MNILSIGTHLFAATWRALGHRVCVVVDYPLPPHPDNRTVDFFGNPDECEQTIRAIADEFAPDVIFQGDRSTPLIHCGLEKYAVPVVWHAIDTHLHHAWHAHYAALFDTVFVSQKNLVATMGRYAPRALWLPGFCQVSTPFVPWNDRTINASFVGTLNPVTNPGRVAFFNDLLKAGASVKISTGEYLSIYPQSRVVVNQSVADDLNLRFFEAIGCGALLVTDRLSFDISEVLSEDTDYLTYPHNDANDCAGKIAWAIGHPVEAEAMARRAYDKILSRHMLVHRAQTVLDELTVLSRSKSCRPDPGHAAAHLAWAHYHCSQLALPPSLSAFFLEKSRLIANNARENSDARPWALLTLAGNALFSKNTALAKSILSQLPALPGTPDFQINLQALQIQLSALLGKYDEARELLAKARQRFPDEALFRG